MSFYGLVLIITVLFLSIYLTAFFNETNSVNMIAAAYARTAQMIQMLSNMTV